MQKKTRRRQSERVRVEDVAAAAGVSGATVSRAINRTGPVSEAIRQRIEKAVVELGYVPNGAARALASHRTRVIGVVIPTLENANFAITAEGAQRYLMKRGYHILVATSDYDPDQEWEQVQSLVSHGVDGIVLVGAQRDASVVEFLRSRRLPFVVTWTLAGDASTPCVGFDNAEAARKLATHLINLGHRHIGVIAGLTRNNDRAAARLEGVRRALSDHKLVVAREMLLERPYRIVEGQLALRALMAMSPAPTAVVCGNDHLAFGALIECGRQGIRVPEQVSVVGFDDLEFASQIVPSLTTVQVPAEEIGRRAAEYLLAHLAGEAAPPTTEVTVSLIVRDSSGPPPRASRAAEDG
ncbi:MAG: substrate-binding domain-containing protein [Mesorhizobium sp.]|nr:substrate-binding domain-containing protein [Mesorhizobium sp.]MBN9245530.1 substrate-binding domain-containing protein [Mesorhizobium sp.]